MPTCIRWRNPAQCFAMSQFSCRYFMLSSAHIYVNRLRSVALIIGFFPLSKKQFMIQFEVLAWCFRAISGSQFNRIIHWRYFSDWYSYIWQDHFDIILATEKLHWQHIAKRCRLTVKPIFGTMILIFVVQIVSRSKWMNFWIVSSVEHHWRYLNVNRMKAVICTRWESIEFRQKRTVFWNM